jgi:hypothetical protein
MKSVFWLKGVCLFSLLALSAAWGQLNRGTITGIVTDPSGAAVAEAKITAVHLETNISSSTSSTMNGNYTLSSLPIGVYRLEVEAAGFKRALRDNVSLSAGVTVGIDVTLEIGSLAESVEVQAASAPIETESTRVGTNITSKLVQDLPLVVAGRIRNVFNLAVIAPEAKTVGVFRIGGGQQAGWDMLMDGLTTSSASTNYQNERAPISSESIDAITEFTVETTGLKAEFGRAMGIINFVTKSGTNQLHGSLFEFLRNDALDARGFFAARRPVLKQSDFGGTFGGPVRIPKIYNGKDRTFFFVNYEGFRNRAGNQPSFNTIPLPAMYEGDFRGWTNAAGAMIPIYDPASTRSGPTGGFVRDAFPNNQIPQGRFSSVASKYAGFHPAEMVPNLPGPRLNYFRDQGSTNEPWNKYSIKVDHQLTAKDKLSGQYHHGIWEILANNNNAPGLPNPFNGINVWARRNTSGRLNWDRTISARILNSLRASYQRERGEEAALNALDPNAKWAEKIGWKGAPGPDFGLPPMNFTEYNSWSASAGGVDKGRDFNLDDNLTVVHGSHTFKAGFFVSIDHWDGGGQQRPNGSASFTPLATAIPGDQSRNSGNAFASFLLGYPDTVGFETPRQVDQFWRYMGGFFQDDWRVTTRLTLNLGLRYEYTSPGTGGAELGIKVSSSRLNDYSSGTLGGFANFDPNTPNPGAGGRPGAMIWSGTGSGRIGSDTLFDGWRKAWSPRLGLAYKLGSGTVIRAYGGRSFSAVKTTAGSTHLDGLILNIDYSSTDLDINNFPTTLDKGLPPIPPLPDLRPERNNGIASTSFWQRVDSGRPPEYYTWNFDIQRQLTHSSSLSLGYTGTRGVHLTAGLVNLNQVDPRYLTLYGPTLLRSNINSPAAQAAGIPIPYPGFNGTVQQALQPFPHFRQIETYRAGGDKSGNSNYQAMILKYDKRYSSGLTILGSYVLSKFFSNADNANQVNTPALDTYNRRLEKGLSGDDQTHNGKFAFSYELPLGKGKRFALGRLTDRFFGGWSFAGFLQYASGVPMAVAPGVNPPIYPLTGANRVFISSYDNWRAPVSGGKFDPFKDVWFNRGAFQQVPSSLLDSALGNATRNNPTLRNPAVFSEDISLQKEVPITERWRISLRFEAFNLLNRVRWNNPDSTYTSSTFGLVRSQANNPRQMQAGLKVLF